VRSVVLGVLLVLSAVLTAAYQRTGECAITYVANAGVLFESNEQKFLFDAPIREGIPPYATPGADELRKLESAAAPFDNVDAILITHWHEDHLSAEAVAAHLRSSPSTRLVSSAEVVDRVRKSAGTSIPAAQFIAVTPEPGTSERAAGSGAAVHVLRIRHNTTRRLPAQHVGFLVEGCRTVLHSGDADPAADNFAVLRSLPRIDTALLPFWYVLSDSSRRLVASSIGPVRILGMHIPPAEADGVKKQLADVPNLTLLSAPGTRVQLRP
jgi:L-ascorbate metabolism protein UlaG (beta-lactamase superfamily)